MSLKNYSAKPGPAGGGILVGRAAEDCYVRGCYVYDIYYGVGLFVENQAPQAARTIVDSNLIIDRLGAAGSGASTSAVFQGTGSLITNNVFVSAGNTTSVYFNLNSTNEDFIHNSIYRLRNPNGQFAIIASSATGLNLQNNSVYFINGGADGYVINIGAGAQAGFTSDNNCFYYTGINGTPYTWGGVGNYATLALWAAQSGTDASSVEDDPLYVNPGADDLHLQVGSPCRGEGAVGTGVTEDYDGVTRGSPPDIGAYEYVP